MRYNNKLKYIAIFSIFLIIISGVAILLENFLPQEIEYENSNIVKNNSFKTQKIPDGTQKLRSTILKIENDIAFLDDGRELKIVGDAKNQKILKKECNIYIKNNEIVKIEMEELRG